DFFDDIPAVKADADMVEIAARIIGQKEAAFDPTRFHDGYDEALKEMIKAKQAGGKGVVAVAEPDDTNVIDLMAALKASLKGPGAAKSASKTKAAPKKKAG
ncbi:MAG: Ku protein, partial [Brevundimonas sp.]